MTDHQADARETKMALDVLHRDKKEIRILAGQLSKYLNRHKDDSRVDNQTKIDLDNTIKNLNQNIHNVEILELVLKEHLIELKHSMK